MENHSAGYQVKIHGIILLMNGKMNGAKSKKYICRNRFKVSVNSRLRE